MQLKNKCSEIRKSKFLETQCFDWPSDILKFDSFTEN